MESKISVGVLTISDRCWRKEAVDESGPNLIEMVRNGVIKNGDVVRSGLVQDSKDDIVKILREWSEEGINVILTTGGTGVAERDVTPEATSSVVEKTIPGVSNLMLIKSLEATPLAALSRAVAGVLHKSLIINLPGSKKGSKECLEAVAVVIPHAVYLILGVQNETEKVHTSGLSKKSSVDVKPPALRNRKSPYPCISVKEAQKLVLERTSLLEDVEIIHLSEAAGRVLAEDVTAQDDLPPFDASIKDGYAVVSADTAVIRKVIGAGNMGVLPSSTVAKGHCMRVSTGGPLPKGADAVIEVEQTEVFRVSENGLEEEAIHLKVFPPKNNDIRLKGSDFEKGQTLLSFRTELKPAALGLLAAAGVTSVRVFRKPTLTVISTGDELADPGGKLEAGKVRDSNRITLVSLLRGENFDVLDGGIVQDQPDMLRNALENGFRKTDVVVTTGSMSMGERDYLKEVLITDFNADIVFGRVFMKPGKPTSFGVVFFENKAKFWFGLPGNPASAFVTSQLFLIPALKKISGVKKLFPCTVSAKLSEEVKLEDRVHYVRGIVNPKENTSEWEVVVTGNQRSSRIESCVNSNCLIIIPESNDFINVLSKGTSVKIMLMEKLYFDPFDNE